MNTMAGNLTTQVRGFAQISAAAMDGDFTRFITVEASGDMDSLKYDRADSGLGSEQITAGELVVSPLIGPLPVVK